MFPYMVIFTDGDRMQFTAMNEYDARFQAGYVRTGQVISYVYPIH